jgi:hypothetical protein
VSGFASPEQALDEILDWIREYFAVEWMTTKQLEEGLSRSDLPETVRQLLKDEMERRRS